MWPLEMRPGASDQASWGDLGDPQPPGGTGLSYIGEAHFWEGLLWESEWVPRGGGWREKGA